MAGMLQPGKSPGRLLHGPVFDLRICDLSLPIYHHNPFWVCFYVSASSSLIG